MTTADDYTYEQALAERFLPPPEAPAHLPAIRTAPAAPAVVQPIAQVVQPLHGVPYYAHVPEPLPAYDPMPARMAGCGVMAFGIGVGAGVAGVGVGFGADLLFTGMSHATTALVGLAAALIAGAVMLVALRTSAGVRIGHFHQGDNSTFRTGR